LASRRTPILYRQAQINFIKKGKKYTKRRPGQNRQNRKQKAKSKKQKGQNPKRRS